MTRDEMREKCIGAMCREMVRIFAPSVSSPSDWVEEMTAAFDALSTAAVRIVPAKATEEMVTVGVRHRDTSQGGLAETFNIMAYVGDLTNDPEKKP